MTTAIITVETLKAWLGITGSAEDAVLGMIVPGVNEMIEDYCETSFSIVTVENEVHDSSRADSVVPKNWPVTEVTRLAINCDVDGVGGTDIDLAQVVVREEEIVLRAQSFPRGRALVSLSYKYGYDGVPEKVKMATLITGEAYYRQRARKSVGITSKAKEGESINFEKSWTGQSGGKGVGIPIEAQGLLQDFRDIGWPSPSEMATGRM